MSSSHDGWRTCALLLADPGSFTNTTGRSSCTLCTAGRFSVRNGTLGATVCTVSTTKESQFARLAEFERVLSRQECARGSANPASGQSACVQCAAGEYAQQTGQAACDKCPTGWFVIALPLPSVELQLGGASLSAK